MWFAGFRAIGMVLSGIGLSNILDFFKPATVPENRNYLWILVGVGLAIVGLSYYKGKGR